jgi:hypothetical protein
VVYLSNTWRLNADSRGFILEQKTKRVDKNGDIVWEPMFYYSSIENALKGFVKNTRNKAVANKDNLSIDDLVKVFSDINDKFVDEVHDIFLNSGITIGDIDGKE